MPLPMLRLLLLLAVFFNTAIGVPAHSASHLRQAAAGTVQALVAAQGCERPAQANPAETGTRAETAEAVCVWCLGHAPQAAAWLPCLGLPVAQQQSGRRMPARALAVSLPAQNRWAFASRDPPR